MFTGLVQGVARIERVERLAADGGVRLTLDARGVPDFAAEVGDSIAINGACMTATQVDGHRFTVDVSGESLSKTSGLDAPGEVNVETSLRVGDKLGGHLVSGHVDGIGTVRSATPEGGSTVLEITAPPELLRYVVEKGSIAVDGVSLTVAGRREDAFTVALIPHTMSVTTLGPQALGRPVNLEVDVVAKYVESLAAPYAPPRGSGQ